MAAAPERFSASLYQGDQKNNLVLVDVASWAKYNIITLYISQCYKIKI